MWKSDIVVYVIIFGFVVFLIIIILLGISDGSSEKIISNHQKNDSIDIEVPDPSKCNPIKFIQFLETTKFPYLGDIRRELDNKGLLNNWILREAFTAKLKFVERFNGAFWRLKFSDEELKEYYDENIDGFKFIKAFEIAGTHIGNRKNYIQYYDFVRLIKEPNNIYDSNAIRIEDDKGNLLGYVPRRVNKYINKFLDYEYIAKVSEIVNAKHYNAYITFYISNSKTTYRNAPKRESVPKPNFDYSNVEFCSPYDFEELRKNDSIKKIDRKFLFPKKEVDSIYLNNIFYRKKIVISGIFDNFQTRNEIAEILYNLGADIDTSVSNRTNFLFIGKESGKSKIYKAEELDIKIITEKDFIEIIKKIGLYK